MDFLLNFNYEYICNFVARDWREELGEAAFEGKVKLCWQGILVSVSMESILQKDRQGLEIYVCM